MMTDYASPEHHLAAGSGSGGSSTRPSLPHGRTTTSAPLP